MRDLVHLFYERQADGFYRPLTYISLLTDYRLFHGTLWAYHLQSIGLHILNAWLLVRLAAALGFGAPAERRLLLFAFLSGLPVLNIVGWIGPSMQQARYVYLPSVWILLMVAAISQRQRQSWILAVLLLANVLGGEYNLSVYRRMLGEAQHMAAAVGKDCRSRGDIQEVDIAGLPSSPYGVAFFDSELMADLRRSVPGARVVRWDSIQPDLRPSQRVYRWDSSHRWGALVAVR